MTQEIVFIIQYRDRETHKEFFLRQMEFVLEDASKDSYEIYFVHQRDKQPFNRGGMRNIGFLAIKEKYPDDYKKYLLLEFKNRFDGDQKDWINSKYLELLISSSSSFLPFLFANFSIVLLGFL